MILNLIKHSNKKLSYITTGQSVPDDIEIAKIDQIAKKLLGSIRI
jgi:flagellar biosynthesis protein FlhF